MMPLQPSELLQELNAAVEEAKAALRGLHEEIKSVKTIRREMRAEIVDAITKEVHAEVDRVSVATERDMQQTVSRVISRLEADWRDKLGLP